MYDPQQWDKVAYLVPAGRAEDNLTETDESSESPTARSRVGRNPWLFLVWHECDWTQVDNQDLAQSNVFPWEVQVVMSTVVEGDSSQDQKKFHWESETYLEFQASRVH
jgi:hypothetical protein